MSILSRLNFLTPAVQKIDEQIRSQIEGKALVATHAAIKALAEVSPELADLLSGGEVELHVSAKITLQLKQKGEA